MTFYHPEENAQVWALECFDNAGELGIEMDDPLYDEFHQVVIRVISEVNGSLRVVNGFVTIDYRDFPVRITECSTGQIIHGDPPSLRSGPCGID